MKYRIALLATIVASFLISGPVFAQKMEAPKDREPGDRAVWNYVVNGKSYVMEENWTTLTADSMVGVTKFGDKEYEIVAARSPEHSISKMICLTNGEVCTFSPPMKIAAFPLEKGKKWSSSYTVTGETFTVFIEDERSVERIETIKTPAGEFETYKITGLARIKGRDKKGFAYTGREDHSTWVAQVSGKMIVVKAASKNSFGEKFTLDLISSSFK